MRGSLIPRKEEKRNEGIIPAHAGLTSRGFSAAWQTGDHPRACGAHSRRLSAPTRSSGSSPRMRGSHINGMTIVRLLGIIPAHAGLTWERLICAIAVRDHPRACGAHGGYIGSAGDKMGSSPRMRGSPLIPMARLWVNGIIPAHAGLTFMLTSRRSPAWDHPRACGAHLRCSALAETMSGSSPRMRGSRSFLLDGRHGFGIIPAHAGLTVRTSPAAERCWDHPRACGAH